MNVAQRNMTCAICKKPIKIGHPYIPYLVPMGHSYKRVEAHPECKEK